MKVEHLGQVMEIDPREAAIQNSVVRYLKRCGPLTEKQLWVRIRGRGLTREEYRDAVTCLCERDIIVRETTNYTDKFILRLMTKVDHAKRQRDVLVEKERRDKGEAA